MGWSCATSSILGLLLHMCFGPFVTKEASQKNVLVMGLCRGSCQLMQGEWRGGGLSQVGLVSSQAMVGHLLWAAELWPSLPCACLAPKVYFHRESLKIKLIHVNPGRAVAGSVGIMDLFIGKSEGVRKYLYFKLPTVCPHQNNKRKYRLETTEVTFHLEYHFSPKTTKL